MSQWQLKNELFFVFRNQMRYEIHPIFCKKSLVQVTQNKVESNESTCNLTYLLSESEVFL